MAFAPGTAGAPTSRVELHIRGRDLLDLDVLSKSDPQVYVFLRDPKTGKWLELGRTEQINDNLNPVFTKSIQVDYRFEEQQYLKFVCVDIDYPGKPMEQQELIGTFECQLGEIVGARGGRIARPLSNPKYPGRSCGTLLVSCEEVADIRHHVVIEFFARNLDKKDWFGKSDPFLRISRAREDGSYDAIHKTEVIKSDLNPRWKRFQIPMQTLCNGDPHRTLLIECFDWNSSGKEDPIGQCTTSLHELQQQVTSKAGLALKLPAKANKRGYTNSGMLYVAHCDVITRPTFLDYIRGGLEINLIIGIDFTASNGNPQDPTSLHFVGHGVHSNEYVKAIRSVASVLAHYDTDGVYPVYGFGAKLPPNGMVSHCFPLNGNLHNAGIQGVENVVNAYAHTLRNVQLYGPTNFAQLVEAAAREASNGTNGDSYTILLILTDGVISDLDNTTDQIVAASNLPLSIVIVGVGGADFKNMEVLDADVRPLVDRRGRKMARDIVQFVPMRDYVNAHPGRIAEVTLEEIPGQIVGYMESRNIKPRPLVRTDTVPAPATQPGPPGGYSTEQLPYPPPAAPYPPTTTPYPTNAPPYPVPTAPYPQGNPPYPTQTPYPYPPPNPY